MRGFDGRNSFDMKDVYRKYFGRLKITSGNQGVAGFISPNNIVRQPEYR